ncbi:MAG: DNA repair protein RecO [Solirubrobacteraceae bacterium]|nr:DNA repair protein RecO [Solirubrobacteraceae bacterium]
MRYGEADRILHLYTEDQGRIGAIAKGVRRAKSRLGGRLEPITRTNLLLRRGRGDLYTITGADTVAPYRRLREHHAGLDMAGRACDAVGRLFAEGEPHPAVFHLLGNELALLESDPGQATHANQLAFRLKLLVAAGLAPQLGSCATCGEADHLGAFSGAAGGVVCAACEAGAFGMDEEAHRFLTGVLAVPLAQAPGASERALRQAERAINATVEHHGGFQLRDAAPRRMAGARRG